MSIHKLELIEVGENFRFDPDDLLEAAKGQEFTRLAILGQKPDGELWVSGSLPSIELCTANRTWRPHDRRSRHHRGY